MAPAHDPYAPAARRPRPTWVLPDVFAVGARSAGATDDELARISEFWWRGTPEDRATAETMIAGLTPAEWVEFVGAWREAMARPEFDPWNDDDDQEATSDASEAQETPPDGSAAVGTDNPGDVHVSLLGPDGEVIDHDLFAELVDLGPAPDGWVEAGWMRPAGTDDDGTPVAIGMRGYVPLDAKAAIAFITEPADGDAVDRARLVLAAELARPAAGRRKKVLAVVVNVLGDDEVTAETVAAGEGLGG